MKGPGPGGLSGVVLLMVLVGCGGCPRAPEDPCAEVSCPEGELCSEGECVSDPDAVECVTFADCPTEAQVCDGGSCRGCQSDSECDSGSICHDGICRSGPIACVDDSDCPGGDKPHCDPSRSVCSACTNDSHCTGLAQVCDRTVGQCVTPTHCGSDADCRDPLHPRCDPASATCVGCLEHSDCDVDARQTCDLSTRSCRDFVPCRRNLDCAGLFETPICDLESGDCVGCLENLDCVPGTARDCDHTVLACVGGIPCSSQDDCVDDALSRCDSRLGFCVDCLSSFDCEEEGSTCDLAARSCRAPVPCSSGADCEGGPTPLCDLAGGYCVECLSAADCGDPMAACVGGICDLGPPGDGRPGSPCSSYDGCALSTATDQYTYCFGLWEDDWKWHQGYCTAFCDRDSDCPDGSMCLGGVCWDRCATSLQCRPGYGCQSLTDGLREANLCAPACDPDIARGLTCQRDSQCALGICDVEAGHCVCSPVGGPCTGLGFCGPRAHCIEETRNGQPTGFDGGYCIIFDCGDLGAPPCPAGTGCYNLGESTVCLPDCDPGRPGSCPRAQYGCNEVFRYVLGGGCLTGSDCPPEAPDCVGAPGEVGTCARLCGEDSDCNVARGHLCTNIQRQIFLCTDPYQVGVCFPGCATDPDCGGCSVDSDCVAGLVCDTGACRRPCSTSTGCQGDICIAGYCSRACADHTDCPRGSTCSSGGCSALAYRCDPVTRRCDPPCSADIDCDRTRICDLSTSRCVTACDDESDDCGPAGSCNLDQLVCEVDCRLLDGLCKGELYCHPLNGECRVRCGAFGDGGCDPDLRCDSMTGECVLPCADLDSPCTHATAAEDCEIGEVCHYGYCTRTCEHDDECAPGLACQWGYCTTCVWPRWRCDSQDSGLCFYCHEDLHCGTSQYCDIKGSYECLGRCGGVNGGTATCPAGEICDVDAGGRCVSPCATSADCAHDPLRPHCHTATGLCGACSRDEHCADPASPRCDPATRICVDCLSDQDCEGHPMGPACHPDLLVCVGCGQDSHCQGNLEGERCDLESAKCVACLENLDCPDATPLCDPIGFECLGCSDHSDCRGQDLCHPGPSECHPPCGDLPADRRRTGSLAGAPAVNTFVDSAGSSAGSALFSFQDGQYAWSMTGAAAAEASFLGFGFSIPTHATVTGIAVSVLASTDGDPQPGSWEVGAILFDSGGERERRWAILTDADQTHVLGGADDTFGEAWTAAQISSPAFGVKLEVTTEESGVVRARVDYLALTVFYTLPGETDCAVLQGDGGGIFYCREDNLCSELVE